jgi:hypothetical protein
MLVLTSVPYRFFLIPVRQSVPAEKELGRAEGDIVNCESVLGKMGSLSVYSYSPHSMRAIHYVPLGPNANQDLSKLCNPIARSARNAPELQFTSF